MVVHPRCTLKEEEPMPWDKENYIPTNKSGKIKTPIKVRDAFQRFLDNTTRSQTSILKEIGVNGPCFRRFMSPKTSPWNAVNNNTYLRAAKFLDTQAYSAPIKLSKSAQKDAPLEKPDKKRKSDDSAVSAPTKSSKKDASVPTKSYFKPAKAGADQRIDPILVEKPNERRTLDDGTVSALTKTSKSDKKDASAPTKFSNPAEQGAEQLIGSILGMYDVDITPIYDTCQEVKKKVRAMHGVIPTRFSSYYY